MMSLVPTKYIFVLARVGQAFRTVFRPKGPHHSTVAKGPFSDADLRVGGLRVGGPRVPSRP